MPGTRTAPDVSAATPAFQRISLNFVDATTDSKSNSLDADPTTTLTEFETYAAETQERSNASLWEIEVASVWRGLKLSSNALSAPRIAVQDNIRYSTIGAPKQYQQAYLPAPLLTQFVTGSETPDVTALGDWFTAVLAVLKSPYVGLNVEFVEHKERNQKVKF